MTPDIDIWRAVVLLLREHGENAETIAAQRADELGERHDHDGRAEWLRIKKAIVELRAAPIGRGH